MKTSIAVIGLGNWGTALAQHLALNKHDVIAWSVFDEEVRAINETGKHLALYPKLDLHFKATSNLQQAFSRPIIVLAIPSVALHHYLQYFEAISSDTMVVSAIKGFDSESLLTPLQLLETHVQKPLRLCVLSGPSFAKDVLNRKPVGLVAASKDEATADAIAALCTSETVRVYTSADPIGVELGAATKNVIATAAGVSDGLDLGESARACLITRGLAEMMRLSEKMGGKRETLSGLSGLGDLLMTASSLTSRNYTVGFRLGKGEKLESILNTLGSVAEGVRSAPIVLELARRHQVDVPITQVVNILLEGKQAPQALMDALLLRPRKAEI